MKLKVEGPDLNPIETMPVLSNKQFDIPFVKEEGLEFTYLAHKMRTSKFSHKNKEVGNKIGGCFKKRVSLHLWHFCLQYQCQQKTNFISVFFTPLQFFILANPLYSHVCQCVLCPFIPILLALIVIKFNQQIYL